jgi:two-component system response regulator PilR (NtrC family)
MNKQRILVADDEQSMREFLGILLRKEGYAVTQAKGGREALDALDREIFDLVITDVRMPHVGGMDVLKRAKEVSPQTPVLMITAYSSTEAAVAAMKEGAFDYLTKPFKVDEIKLVIRNALERRHLQEENLLLRREIETRFGFENFLGKSEAMQKVFALIKKIADTRSTVLITGESGTGKELAARAIHAQSPRRESPFVTVNCAALPETLLESELFGHMKGSFTGAIANKEGLFETANSGTIFLDEISATTPALQVKLLRVIQEREFKRVGGTQDIQVDVRIIAATNKDLAEEVRRGAFREDLYYRLNVIPLYLPPLRERREDIPLLSQHFLNRYAAERRKDDLRLAPEAMQRLIEAPWRGNVRELENTIERAVALSEGSLVMPDLLTSLEAIQPSSPPALQPSRDLPPEGVDLEALIAETEKALILKALERTRGSKTEAAKLLGLTFRSLRHRVKKYGL